MTAAIRKHVRGPALVVQRLTSRTGPAVAAAQIPHAPTLIRANRANAMLIMLPPVLRVVRPPGCAKTTTFAIQVAPASAEETNRMALRAAAKQTRHVPTPTLAALVNVQ